MEINFEIKRRIGVIAERKNGGWTKELNMVSWNDQPAKYDIREWDEYHERMSKGLTFTEEEAKRLYAFLKEEFDKEDK